MTTHHPKHYTLLHLAVELNSLSACRAIMRCGDECGMDPGFHLKDLEGLIPVQRATKSRNKDCLNFCNHNHHIRLCAAQKEICSANFKKQLQIRRVIQKKKLLVSNPSLLHEPYVDGSICLHKAGEWRKVSIFLL